MLMGNIDLANVKFMKTSFGPYGNFKNKYAALKHEIRVAIILYLKNFGSFYCLLIKFLTVRT